MWACSKKLWILQTIEILLLISTVMGLPEVIKIGAIFETNDYQHEFSFRKAIEKINLDDSRLPRTKLRARVKSVAPQDSFRTLKMACDFLEEGMAGIVGPKSPSNRGALHSISDNFEVPLLLTHWTPILQNRTHAINFFPHTRILTSAFTEFITDHGWKSITLIFEDIEALIRLQEILQLPTTSKENKIRVTLRHAKPDADLSKLIKDLSKLREQNFVLDLPLHRIKELFNAAFKIEMMTEYQNYLLTSLDVHTVEWDHTVIGKSNITAYRIVNPETDRFRKFLSEWLTSGQAVSREPSRQPITTEAALLYDAVMMLTQALDDLDRGRPMEIHPLHCEGTETWKEGTSLISYMETVPFEGLSGTIKIDKYGFRSTFSLDVVKVTTHGIEKKGTWDTENHFEYKKEKVGDFSEAIEKLRNTTLRVTSILNEPYLMLKKPAEGFEGNDAYEGICKDLLDMLQAKLGFKYVIHPAKDGKHGALANGVWNGMIGELLRMEADIAIGDLSITSTRETVVDFTMPWMNLGISILFKKPDKQSPAMFSFLKPLSLEVWFYMLTAYLGVSLYLFILARLTPYEWVNPSPSDPDSDVVENQYTLLNSFWFTIGTLMRAGSDILPRAISTRIVAISWSFFNLIMISSYTANLAAFLTAQRMTSPIESAADLAKQTQIAYGCVKDGSTMNFFKDSNYPVYKRMWSFMESERPSVFPDKNEKGISRVKMGNYAFLMESTSIEYFAERDCELTKIGKELDSKGYGIATPRSSPYRGLLSTEILRLQETQQLQILKDKWWKVANRCVDDSSASSAEMGIRNVGGVFLVLVLGPCLGVVFSVMEFIWKAKKIPHRDPILFMLWHELRAILTCRGSTRTVPTETEEEPIVSNIQMFNLNKGNEIKVIT